MAIARYTSPPQNFNFLNFVGGLNSTASALALSDQESSDLQNIDFNKFGSIVKRSGYTPINTSAIFSGAQICGLHFFEKSDQTRYLIAIGDSKIAYWDAASLTGNPTDITGSITITPGSLCDSATFRDTALFTNDSDAPFQWSGTGNATTMTVPTNLTNARFVKVFQSYTVLANVTVAGTHYGSRIYYSNINKIDTWTDLDFVDVSRDDGQVITGLKVLGDKLVIFKDRTIWVAQFTGNADAPLSFSQANSSVGCVSFQTIQEKDNGLEFLSWDGLYFFDGFNSYKLSDRLNKTFTSDMNPVKFSNACSMYQHTKNRYWLGIALSGSSTNNRVITHTRCETNNTQTDAFGIYKGINASYMCMAYPDGVTETPIFGDYNGYVYKADTGLDDYPANVQTAIDAYYYTNWIFFGDLVDQKSANTVIIYYQIKSATLTLSYSYDFVAGDTFSQNINTAGSGALWGSATWGVDKWAATGGANQRVQIDGRGRNIRLKFSNSTLSETFQVDGLGINATLETYQG